MFRGIYTCPLDEKNRVVLPIRLRDAVPRETLKDGFVVTQGFEGCLMMFLRDHWRELEARFAKLPFTNPKARLFKRFFLSPALPVPVDGIGRMMIADFHREIAQIQREVMFTGLGDSIEVWSPDRWRSYRAENLAKFEEAAASLLGEEGLAPQAGTGIGPPKKEVPG